MKNPKDENLRGDKILSHLMKVRVAKQAADDANGELSAVWKKAKADGVPIDEAKLATKILKKDPADALRFIQNVCQILEIRSPGLLTQRDLFSGMEAAAPDKLSEHDLKETEAAGFLAGQRGDMGMHDHGIPGGTERAARWVSGYMRGQEGNAPTVGGSEGTKVVPIRGAKAKAVAEVPAEGINTGPVLPPVKAMKPVKAAKPKAGKSELKVKGPKTPAALKKAVASDVKKVARVRKEKVQAAVEEAEEADIGVDVTGRMPAAETPASFLPQD